MMTSQTIGMGRVQIQISYQLSSWTFYALFSRSYTWNFHFSFLKSHFNGFADKFFKITSIWKT